MPETPSGASVIPHAPVESAAPVHTPAAASATPTAATSGTALGSGSTGPARTPSTTTTAGSRASEGRAPAAPANAAKGSPAGSSPAKLPSSGSVINAKGIDLKSLKIKCKAKAVFDYVAADDTELGFVVGDTIEVFNVDESGWWEGVLNGRVGMFPGNHVERLPDEKPPAAVAAAPAAAPVTAAAPAAVATTPAATASPSSSRTTPAATGAPSTSAPAPPAVSSPKQEHRKCKVQRRLFSLHTFGFFSSIIVPPPPAPAFFVFPITYNTRTHRFCLISPAMPQTNWRCAKAS